MDSDIGRFRLTSTLVNNMVKEMEEHSQVPSSHSELMDHSNTETDQAPTSSLPTPEPQLFVLPDPSELNGEFPILSVPNMDVAFSRELMTFLYARPAVLLRGLVDSVGVDLKLFSSYVITAANPSQRVERRRQEKQPGHSNCLNGKSSWQYQSVKLKSATLQVCNKYQALSYLAEAKEMSKENVKRRVPKRINFGTNLDLSNGKVWWEQLAELRKLPPFARVDGEEQNFLNHVGYPLLGMNTVQLYMKVPGSRTPGHQENNNFCAININVGPGDSEWFAVLDSHWKEVNDLCQGHGLNFLSGAWWPDLEDLRVRNIPVLRVVQKPGDMIWLNCGTVHWVQALGFCNNIAWNVGPVTGHQFEAAVERFHWNQIQKFRSIVPILHLTWNVARTRNLRFTEQSLLEHIKTFLHESFNKYASDSELLTQKGIQRTLARPASTDPAPYCAVCKVEVFGVFLLLEGRKVAASIYCLQCALKEKENLEGFQGWEQYSSEELFRTLESFGSDVTLSKLV